MIEQEAGVQLKLIEIRNLFLQKRGVVFFLRQSLSIALLYSPILLLTFVVGRRIKLNSVAYRRHEREFVREAILKSAQAQRTEAANRGNVLYVARSQHRPREKPRHVNFTMNKGKKK